MRLQNNKDDAKITVETGQSLTTGIFSIKGGSAPFKSRY